MTEGDAKMIYAKGVMEEDRDTMGMSIRHKDMRYKQTRILESCYDLSDAALLVNSEEPGHLHDADPLHISYCVTSGVFVVKLLVF